MRSYENFLTLIAELEEMQKIAEEVLREFPSLHELFVGKINAIAEAVR